MSDAATVSSEKPQRSFWETVIITTPVLLTVLATLLAGLSNSEMTQAQYYRALAAQYQSKAGDQWAFFQAKRIRGSSLELTADLLPSWGQTPSRIFPETTERLRKCLERVKRQAGQLQQAAAAAGDDLGPARDKLIQAARRLQEAAASQTVQVAAWEKKIATLQRTPESSQAFKYLDSQKLPVLSEESGYGALVERVLKAAHETKDEELHRKVSEIDVHEALTRAGALSRDFSEKAKSINRAIDNMGSVVDGLRARVAKLQDEINDLAEAEGEMPVAKNKSFSELRALLAAVFRSADLARTLVNDLKANFHAARHEFRALTYEREARQNQTLAELYEVVVRRASVESERHRGRSRSFFYGMLGAQAAVTIATFALAVRRKSILWSLASAAGLAAVLFGSYVYVYM